ncbi:8125_t:CDS:2, partial [Racocetra persica]
ILVLAFAHSLHLLLRPVSEYSYDQPSNTNDANNPWSLVPTYKFVSSNGSVGESSIIKTPDDNTNLFTMFSTSILAVYFMLTGDSSAISSWDAINQTYNEESFLHLRGEILAEIELFWMLPHQRRKKTWFPEILYYEASVHELKKYVKNLQDEHEDEILQNLLPKIKEIAEFKDNDEILKNLLPETEKIIETKISNLLPETEKIIETKISNLLPEIKKNH